MLSAVSAVDGNTLTAELKGKFVCLIDVCCCGVFAEVYGLTDRCVAVLLEGSLHSDVPFGLDIIGAFEDLADFGWYLSHFLNTAGFGNLSFQFFAVESVLFSYLSEDRVSMQHF